MKRPLPALFAAIALVVCGSLPSARATTSTAGKPLGVVELFTSQGCSSCPPADSVLGEMASRGDVVALAYHVDYWDYLGWRDTLARKENTQRQYDYGKAFRSSSVYTPQAVINGRTDVNGASRWAVTSTLNRLSKQGLGLNVPLGVTKKGDSVVIEVGSAPGFRREAHLVLVYYDPVRPIQIDRGENKGATISYWNAVRDVQTAGVWHGGATRFELPESEIAKAGGCAALLQAVDRNGLPGAIIGAAIVRAPDTAAAK